MDGKTIRPLVVEISCGDEVRMLTLAAARSVMPGAAFLLMLAAPLTDLAVARIILTKFRLFMPIAALWKLILNFVQLVHFLGMSVARGLARFVQITLLDAAFGITLPPLRSITVFGGAITNLMTNAIDLSLIHCILMSLLCGAR